MLKTGSSIYYYYYPSLRYSCRAMRCSDGSLIIAEAPTSLSGSVLAAIVVCCLIAVLILAVIAVILVLLLRRRRQRRKEAEAAARQAVVPPSTKPVQPTHNGTWSSGTFRGLWKDQTWRGTDPEDDELPLSEHSRSVYSSVPGHVTPRGGGGAGRSSGTFHGLWKDQTWRGTDPEDAQR